MLSLHAAGHLIKTPTRKTTAKGTDFATAPIVATTRDGDLVLNITAFDPALVELLSGLQKGDAVSVMGQATVGIWTSEDGPRPSVGITATRIMAMADKAAQPGKRKPPAPIGAAAPEPFDDECPF